MRALIPFLSGRKGNATIVFALCLPVLVGFAGLSVEAGFWYFRQRQVQTAADLAAFAGAVSLRNNEGVSQARDEATAEAVRHGFLAAEGSLAASSPPSSGAYVNARSMEIVIEQHAERIFSQMFVQGPITLHARAVATYTEPTDSCILALDYEAARAVEFFGSSNVSLLNCEVMSNSIASDSIELRGTSDVEAPCINAVGGYHRGGTAADLILTDCPSPRLDLPRALDPYADVDPPDASGPCQNLTPGETNITAPGGVRRFCGGLSLNGDHHFEPGIYVIDGGTFSINGGAHVTGDGVTFYLTGGAEVSFNGNATIEFTAPSSGEYAGLVFFGDRDDFGSEHQFNGTANSSITGAMYFPAGDIYFLGDFSGDNGCMQLVGRTVHVGGNANIETDCTGTGIRWGQVPGDVRLVE